jgi:8-oxo-dGTP diphosphatase
MNKENEKIEVHVAGVCFYKGKVLVMKRSENKRLYPGLWECGGGKVSMGETFEDAIIREIGEETNMIVEVKGILCTYSIDIPNDEQKVIPGLKFILEVEGFIDGDSPRIGDEHTEYRFISKEEVKDIDFISGIDEEILEAFERMGL